MGHRIELGEKHIAQVLALRTLLISLTCIDDGFRDLSNLPALEELHLDRCPFRTNAGIGQLSRLSSLKNLRVYSCDRFIDEAFQHIASVTGLKKLVLCDMWNMISGTSIAHLAALPALEVLCLQNFRTGDPGVLHLHALRSLRSLDLSVTSLSNAGMPHLAALTGLTELRLNRNYITDVVAAHLASLKELQVLELVATGATSAGVAHLTGVMTALRVTSLRWYVADCCG